MTMDSVREKVVGEWWVARLRYLVGDKILSLALSATKFKAGTNVWESNLILTRVH